ncbi:MAG: TlpA disulfide reductase family protein [Arenibacter algicola]
MKLKITFFLIFLILVSCKKEKLPHSIAIDLEINQIDNPFSKSMNALRFLDSIPKEFNGIINRDSSYVLYLNIINPRDLQSKVKEGKLEQETIDTLKSKIYTLSGFNKGMQYFIVDLNGNKDFSDDEIIKFQKSIFQNENYRDSFNIKSIEVTKLSGDKFHKGLTYLQFLPAPNYFTYKKETATEKFKHSLQLAALKHDFLYGTFKMENENYGVGVNKGWKSYEFIFKKSDTSFYKQNHQMFAKYLLKDTLRLNNKYYVIDSLSTFPPKLTLNEVNIKGVKYGFRTNEISKNYQITDLNGATTNLKSLAKEKGLILLDFWGTWCAPCKELTPELVKLHQKYGDKLEFVSLAFELDTKPVLEYATKNHMNWYNGIIKGKPKSGDMSSPIIGGLRIECYPTFIVLDPDLNILFRTCGGGGNYSDLKAFISSKLE